MDITIDVHSRTPIYLQLVERIKHLIAAGRLKPGDQLPTVRRLARQLAVNPNTVARAYVLLDQAGIISTQQGRGTYVREHLDRDGLGHMRREKLRGLIGKLMVEARSLGYDLDEIEDEFQAVVRQQGRRRQA